MINKIWNWIKNIFKPEKQDPHMTLYEEVKKGYCDEHSKYKHRCPKCRELARMA